MGRMVLVCWWYKTAQKWGKTPTNCAPSEDLVQCVAKGTPPMPMCASYKCALVKMGATTTGIASQSDYGGV